MKKIIWGTLAGVIVSFATAFAWHLTIFKDRYESLGVLGRMEPKIGLGFLATLILSMLLAYLYPRIIVNRSSIFRDGIRFGLTFAALNITLWVLKYAATQPLASVGDFILIESAFEVIQYTLVGFVLAAIYR